MTEYSVLEYRNKILRKANLETGEYQIALDIGCGDGGDSELLLNVSRNVVGIDIRLDFKWQKKKKPNLNFGVVDSRNLPFKNGCFDIVFIKDVLHHVSEPRKVLGEIARVTNHNGKIIIVESNRYNPILYLHMTLLLGHQHFTKKYFEQLISSIYNDANFITTESHVYPINSKPIINLIHFVEDIFERIPIIKNFLSYNLAIITTQSKKIPS